MNLVNYQFGIFITLQKLKSWIWKKLADSGKESHNFANTAAY